MNVELFKNSGCFLCFGLDRGFCKLKGTQMLLEKLDKKYFWDVDMARLDDDASKRLIIERVITLGSLKDFHKILNYYGNNSVLETTQNLNYLDDKTLHFMALFFNQPLDSFKCFIRKQSNHTHWNS